MSAGLCGVRLAPGGKEVIGGRLTFTASACNGEIALGSGYGVSGGTFAKQAPWLQMLGVPFVLGADRQCLSSELGKTGLPQFVGVPTFALQANPRQVFGQDDRLPTSWYRPVWCRETREVGSCMVVVYAPPSRRAADKWNRH